MGTVIVGVILLAVVAAVIGVMVRDRKKGKTGPCGGNCASCGMCSHRK